MTAEPRPWSVWPAIAIALFGLVLGEIAFVAAAAIHDAVVAVPEHVRGLTGVAAHGTPPVESIAGTAVQDLSIAAAVVLVVRFASGGRLRLDLLGLRGARVGSSVAFAVLGYVLFLVVSGVWTQLLGISDRENVAVDLGTRDSALALIGSGLLVGAVAPVAEELFFRGFVFGALRRYGFWPAALVTGLLFGGAHVASSPIGFLLPLAVLGVILCAVYERTGSLLPCVGLHCINNSVALGVADGRAWIVPACLVVCGLLIAGVVRVAARTPATA